MRILALETTEMIGSLAVMADGNLLAENELDKSQRSAQSLAPGMKKLLDQVGWKPSDVQLVAVSSGPGSFTGLRIGLTTAKMFAYAVGAEILGINTLETIAAAAPEDVRELSVVLDAQRGQLAEQRFVRHLDGWLQPARPERLIDTDDWLAQLSPEIVVSGPILKKLAPRLPPSARVLDRELWSPRASMVARLALRDYTAGRRDDLWQLVPHYCRRSAAEEKLNGLATHVS